MRLSPRRAARATSPIDVDRRATTGKVVVGGFVALTVGLLWTRLAPLHHSLWRDEIVTVVDFVRPGPVELFLGDYTSNNHMLFTLLAWSTTWIFGESEVALRVWSAVPFIAAVVVGTAWLYRRWAPLTAVAYAFLVVQSPLLLDLSVQARGYGLAFLAMTVLVVAACESLASGGRRPVLAFCAAGIVGTWTLPTFILPFAATSAVLLCAPSVRRRLLPWLGGAAMAIGVWYLPVLEELATNSKLEFGSQLAWHAALTAPFTELFAYTLGAGRSGLASVGAFVLFGVLVVAGVRATARRSRFVAIVLVSGVVVTYLALTVLRFYVEPRFVSWLLAPLFMLTAIGLPSLVGVVGRLRLPTRVFVTAAAAVVVVWLGAVFVVAASRVVPLPIEANREAAEAVEALPRSSKVVVNLWLPESLGFYLDRPYTVPPPERMAEVVCEPAEEGLIVVGNKWRTPDVDLSCLERAGATRRRVKQRARGTWIDVWFLPGSPSS